MALTPTIRNWRTSPPRGSWSLVYSPPERPGVTIDAVGHTYDQILAHIRLWRTNNGLLPDDAGVFSFCNGIWCERDPGRCLSAPAMPEPPAGAGRRILTPHDYGRVAWSWLHYFGVHFNPVTWKFSIGQIHSLIDPGNINNNGSGCAKCFSHFNEFLTAFPPHKVTTAGEAAVWSFRAHDAANVYSGKAYRPSFRQCAALYGWEMLSTDQVDSITSSLRI